MCHFFLQGQERSAVAGGYGRERLAQCFGDLFKRELAEDFHHHRLALCGGQFIQGLGQRFAEFGLVGCLSGFSSRWAKIVSDSYAVRVDARRTWSIAAFRTA